MRAWRIYDFVARRNLSWGDVADAVGLGFITMVRVMVLIALASVVWTPIGIYVGLRPHLTADRAAGGAVPGRVSRQHPVSRSRCR